MGFRDRAKERLRTVKPEHAEKALENLLQRRAWIVTKMATNVSLTAQPFDSDLSKLAQELFFLDAAIEQLEAMQPAEEGEPQPTES